MLRPLTTFNGELDIGRWWFSSLLRLRSLILRSSIHSVACSFIHCFVHREPLCKDLAYCVFLPYGLAWTTIKLRHGLLLWGVRLQGRRILVGLHSSRTLCRLW